MDVFSPIWVYILKCSDGTLYTGLTRNLENRLRQHNHNHGAAYTSKRKPVELVFKEEYLSHAHAFKREREIKRLSHDQKLQLIVNQM